ncbi:hypothetical protein THRCLA_04421 [Thraustotheca clavata]|uniref:Kynureninase n=1 Tax=Thraustotheca clavata TaxID=74557 RepID=A0A1V9ZZ49_9STRA|nr:hypothetical protein THRCLA_04421 [Thraustotheca clavata]
MVCITREECIALDKKDVLASLRDQFDLPPNQIYLDGNSLGVLPKSTRTRLIHVLQEEWGRDLIRSWNTAGWMDMPNRVGDKIARLVGAAPGELIVADSTSVNLYKILSVALKLVLADTPERRTIISDKTMFPSDIYMMESLAKEYQLKLLLVDTANIVDALDDTTALVLLTPVSYLTGEMVDMNEITSAVHSVGGLMLWDLAHSAGAHEVDLNGCNADFAVGCGYKYLNGGPGAPSFVWAHPRHVNRVAQPLTGWLGHAAPFAFDRSYTPAPGIQRYIAGSPPILSMVGLECGVDTMLAAEPFGGMKAIRAKSIELTELFINCVKQFCSEVMEIVSPLDVNKRGSQVCLRFVQAEGNDTYGIVQALIARGIVGDFRAPDILRFGFTPLYTRFVDVFNSVQAIVDVLNTKEYKQQLYQVRAKVT